MNQKLIKYLSILLLLAGFTAQVYAVGVTKGGKRWLRKTTGTPVFTKFNINQISTWFVDDGSSDLDNLGNAGFVFPKGSAKTAFFQSGFVWGGKIGDYIHVGGSTYQSGVLPGAVINGVPQSPDDPNVKIWRVRRDYKTGGMTTEIADGEGIETDIRAQYDYDWQNWPADLGAPYEDVNGDGKYDPAIDIPGVPGADQTIWYVNNDFDAATVQALYGSLPIGVECQTTVWGYNIGGPLGSMLFRRYKLINKGQNDVTDMYISMWSDPDDGDAGDDLAGCDTTLSLGYIYNGNNHDKVYGANTPAGGFDFFQGPVVPGAATDSAIFNGRRIHGKKNLPMTAFYYFINSNSVYADPDLGNYYETGTKAFYRLLQGMIGTTGEYFPIPSDLGGGVTKFPLSGDPITGTGYVDGKLFDPGDRRIGMSSGPFNFAVGDTQEIVVAQIVAGGPGSGLGPIDAVKALKNYDKKAQEAYDKFFVLPSAPRAPIVDVTELDQEIDLNWGSHLDQVAQTESHDKEHYKFEGYNLYQLPRANSLPNEAVRIATYDIVNDVKLILDDAVDPKSGLLLKAVKQFGNDSGIKRSFKLDRDYVTNLPLVNGKKYFYAVTAYAYDPDSGAVPNNLESPMAVITCIPHTPDPGVRYNAAYGDTLKVTRLSGKSDGFVVPIVVDPAKLNGHTYKVTFDTLTVDGTLSNVWTLKDETANKVLVSKKYDQTGAEDSLRIFDGLLIKVLGCPNGVKSWKMVSGTRKLSWSGGNLGYEGFNGALGSAVGWWGSTIGYDAQRNILYKFAKVDSGGVFDPNDPNVSYAYRYLRNNNLAPAKPEFAPYIVKTTPTGYGFQEFAKTCPVAAYDIEDPAHPRRLAVGYTENNVAGGLVDGKYWPPTTDGNNTAGTGSREWLFVFDVDYSETANPLYEGSLLNNPYPLLLHASWTRKTDSWVGNEEMEVDVNHINLPADAWSFTSKTVDVSDAYAKEDVEKINVFPNPYYGVNSQELNKYQRFVTFSHLPQTATIRIFNLAGQLVRTIHKDSPNDQFQRWDLATDSGLPVASGLYIVYVDMPKLGKTKILKVAVIQEQQILDRF